MEKPKNSFNNKQDKLKEIIRQLHEGVPADELQNKFKEIIKDTSPEEIADMENSLIEEGFPLSEIQRLCDVHAKVFEESLSKVKNPAKIPGHPVYTFIQENKKAKILLKTLKNITKKLNKGKSIEKYRNKFNNKLNSLKEINKHYLRKENQLFPLLEEKKFTGPTKVMWGKHDEIRESIKKTEHFSKKQEWKELYNEFKKLAKAIKKMIFLEEKILYPTSMKKLSEKDWIKIKKGGGEIGYSWIKPSDLWDANLATSFSKNKSEEKMKNQQKKSIYELLHLSEGNLSLEQINHMLKSLPVDISFVDENDVVRYYSDTKDRVFPRSPSIIGRKVQNCHPPKSVHMVNKIIKSFREKKKNVAEFWITMDEKFIHIRYFPIYNNKGEYKGVIEVSQDVTKIRKLKGEKRLLDWE